MKDIIIDEYDDKYYLTKNIVVVDRESEDGNARRFVRFLEECDAVRLTLCGHIHGYSDTEIVPGKHQITASQGMIGFVGRLTVKGTV